MVAVSDRQTKPERVKKMSVPPLKMLMSYELFDHSPHATALCDSVRVTIMGTLGVSRVVILERLCDQGGTTEVDPAWSVDQPRLLPAIAGDLLMWHSRWYVSRTEDQRRRLDIWSLPQFERALERAVQKMSQPGEPRSIYELFLESLYAVGEMGCSCRLCSPKEDPGSSEQSAPKEEGK